MKLQILKRINGYHIIGYNYSFDAVNNSHEISVLFDGNLNIDNNNSLILEHSSYNSSIIAESHQIDAKNILNTPQLSIFLSSVMTICSFLEKEFPNESLADIRKEVQDKIDEEDESYKTREIRFRNNIKSSL